MPKAQGTIIIKKIKKGEHAHHGGAWKVAYADFVTAMMAFFLLLWLLNVTTDVQKRGLAEYFDPSLASRSISGAGGVLGGRTIGSEGSQMSAWTQATPQISYSTRRRLPEIANDSDSESDDTTIHNGETVQNQQLSEEELERQLAEREKKRFAEAKQALEQAVTEVPELKALAKNLLIDETPEGLRIQLVDEDRTPMYPLGSAEMLDPAKKLVSLVAQVIAKLPNKISITGHTDSTQYAFSARYTNWELSVDRANASRREFLADGLPPDRISRVMGVADREPLDKENPGAPHNRRISIVLLREAKDMSASAAPTPKPAATAPAAIRAPADALTPAAPASP